MSGPAPVVLAEGLAFPEGPAFAPDGGLWWVEVDGGRLGRWREGEVERIAIGGRPNGLAVDAAGRVWICDQGERSVRRHDPRSGETVTAADHLDGAPLGRPNDLAFDRLGNLVFTCPNDARTEPAGYVCCLAPDGALTRVADGLYFPNGLAFTPDGAGLVVAETYRHRLWIGAWDAEARLWRDPRPWVEVGGPVGPDGLAFAEDGTLFAAIFGQGVVRAVSPRGEVRPALGLPGAKPTNVALDPAGRLGLVVTEAERGQLLAYPAMAAPPALLPRLR